MTNNISTYSVTWTWEFFNLNEKYQVLSVHFTVYTEPWAKGTGPVFQKCPSLLSNWLGLTRAWQPFAPCQARLLLGLPPCHFWTLQIMTYHTQGGFRIDSQIIKDLTDHLSRWFIFINKNLDTHISDMNS